jgi:hypothetical protein
MRTGPPTPNLIYRETIRYSAEGERKYIRYYDGRGHFGHVQLRLIPHPGEACSVSCDTECNLPKECCQAAHDALMSRFEFQPRGHFGLIGFEVRLTGGSYLEPHSYPEAYAHAACMALDEAFRRAGRVVVERYTGILLVIDLDDLVWSIKALRNLLGEVHASQTVTNVARLRMDVPVQLLGKIRSMGLRIERQFPLPSEKRYRPLLTSEAGHTSPGDLGEWT